MDHYQ